MRTSALYAVGVLPADPYGHRDNTEGEQEVVPHHLL
jgi:hypothetical protein